MKLLARFTVFGLIVLTPTSPGFALAPRKKLTQYVYDSWGTKENLAQGTVREIIRTRDGYLWLAADDWIWSICSDRDGALWIATDNGLSRIKGPEVTVYTTQQELSSDAVWCVCEDRQGNIWAGTNGGGLNRFKDGKFTTVTTKDGLPDDMVFNILEDDNRNFWISSNNGIFKIPRRQLEDFFDGKRPRIRARRYDEDDGMPSRECTVFANPAGWKSRDGKLWFPTKKGLVMIEPGNIRVNPKPPPVKIETMVADNRTIHPPFNSTGEKLPELPALLQKTELDRKWKMLSETLILDELEQFSNEMIRIDRDYGSGILTDWARQLIKDVKSFDIDKIEQTLSSFPRLVKRIEQLSGGVQ
ncbi:MAG: hypothetical protein GY940_19600 [bacterium]|nr:hypothetical protein [bacterium]